MSAENINDILNDKYNNNEKHNEIFTMFYNDAISNDNVFGALGIATFSNDKTVLLDAIQQNHMKNYFRNNGQNVIQSRLIMNYKV